MTDQNEPNIITIRNEEDAWRVFELAMKDQLPTLDTKLLFANWPTIEIKLKGEKHFSSLTAKNMAGLIELQKTINRSYALLRFDSLKTNKIPLAEKKQLEISFKVSDGCSDVLTSFEKPLTEFAKVVGANMEPKHVIITVLGTGLLWGGTVCWKTWLQHRKEILELREETKRKEIEEQSRQFASSQETERMDLLIDAFQEAPLLEKVSANTDEMYDNVLKSTLDADSVSIAGLEGLKRKTINRLTRNSRTRAVAERYDGIYKIVKVDSSSFDFFKISVRSTETGEEFSAKVQEKETASRTEKMKQCIKEAEWSKSRHPIYLKINVKKRRGVITSATILDAKEVTEED